jgi:pyridoxal phosphate enzyme (YggS family)
MIAENINIVEEKVANSCKKSGRDRSEITLIAVSKTQNIETINECLAVGIKDLGENKAQELKDKSELILGNIRWHFIGHLQTNKVKYIINSAEYIHSVDSQKLAEEINRKAELINKKQKVLLEIKTSSEVTKYGLENDLDILNTVEFCAGLSHVNLVGLMTMAPYTDNFDVIRNCFIKLREIKERVNGSGFNLTELSMGMTNDFEIAIEEGTTMLRIGSAIFGERNYK